MCTAGVGLGLYCGFPQPVPCVAKYTSATGVGKMAIAEESPHAKVRDTQAGARYSVTNSTVRRGWLEVQLRRRLGCCGAFGQRGSQALAPSLPHPLDAVLLRRPTASRVWHVMSARANTPAPQLVSAAVERVLGRTVGADAVLMAAGLDSLGSEELVAELSKIGKIDLPGAEAALQPCMRCGAFGRLTHHRTQPTPFSWSTRP